jgi:hypothetical protein
MDVIAALSCSCSEDIKGPSKIISNGCDMDLESGQVGRPTHCGGPAGGRVRRHRQRSA